MAQILHPALVGANHQKLIQLAERFALQVSENAVLRNGIHMQADEAKMLFLHNPQRTLSVDYHTISLGVMVPFFPMLGDYVLFSQVNQTFFCLNKGWVDARVMATGFHDLQTAKQYLKANSSLLEDARVQYLPDNHEQALRVFIPKEQI